ncbi:MAG: SUMF1/EgtB/PvdO family nonheme iron enzyme [Spirochaetaceae bacterium]|nr:SUMF1/EgtB/PvdO family nonheme iron enzyme [Spirochaetaceae bacterium]
MSENLGKTTININLDLSKLIKNSRNDDTQINGYVLKLFVYDAKNYQEGDKEIEKLPLLTQTSNKVDMTTGTVKASLEVAIDSTVIFVGKLFTLNENDVESDKPLYAGKSEVFKVQPKDNKVHLVLSREKSEIGFEIELAETHKHTFADSWSTSLTHHWKGTTCGHNDVMADFTEHSFSDWTTTQPPTEEDSGSKERTFSNWTTTKEPTEEVAGSKERTCEECNYKEVVEIANLAHTHKFAEEWSASLTHHWKGTTCGHSDVMADFTKHSFSDWTTTLPPTEEVAGSKERTCEECNYKEVVEIAKLAHTHKFATGWNHDAANHWKAATCEHKEEVSEKAAHTFGDWETITAATEDAEGSKKRTCSECNYEDTAVIEILAHTHTFADSWTPSLTHHWKEANCGHTENVTGFGEHSFVDEVCTVCTYTTIPTGFVLIKGGTFQMGSTVGYSDEKPVHEVNLTKNFYMGKYEVTQGEYEKYCGYGETPPSSGYGDGDNYPAYYVSWYDALVYCNKRSIDEGLTPCYSINGEKDPTEWGIVPTESNSTSWDAVVCEWGANGYRLPTEAEWEYAARAGDDTTSSKTYSGTSDVTELGKYAWYTDNSGSKTHIVGQMSPNAFDLYDMSGNVCEWCWNWFTDSYDTGKEGGSDPTGASAGSYRVYRGGSWDRNSDLCAVSCRDHYFPYDRDRNLGFRVVRASSK